MTDNGGNDRRRDIEGRINTIGTGNSGVSDRPGTDAEEQAEEIVDELEDEAGTEADTEEEADTEDEAGTEPTGVTPEADTDDLGDDEEAESEDDDAFETREEDADDRSSLEVEMDRFVRAFAARRAAEADETLDEYVVGSVKGYLAGLLGGDVESPGTLKREVEVEADEIFGGLLDIVADDEEDRGDVVLAAVAEAYDVADEDSLTVAGLRDHEALLNGVVANNSNSLGDVSEVVQAAVETRLIEEPAD